MTRRELMFLLAGAMTVPRAVRAQQETMPVIGYLHFASPGSQSSFLAAFRQGLRETGYVEGENVALEHRWAEGKYDRLPALATDLVSRKVDVIVAVSGPSALAAKNASSKIPIVFMTGAETQSAMVWSPASPARAVISPELAFYLSSCIPSGSNCFPTCFPTRRRSPCSSTQTFRLRNRSSEASRKRRARKGCSSRS